MKLLMLVDHAEFAEFDSVFRLAASMRHLWWTELHVASRSDPRNHDFWQDPASAPIWTRRANKAFNFQYGADWFHDKTGPQDLPHFDGVISKLEPPLDFPWLTKLKAFEDRIAFINSPHGMMAASSKLFLEHFADLVPGFAVCRSVEEARAQVAQQKSVVFKPAYGSSGRGLMRVGPDGLWLGSEHHDGAEVNSPIFDQAIDDILPCIAMKFLPDVVHGDKRILVFEGEVLGSVLRVPEPGTWLANVAQGGHVAETYAEPEEMEIIDRVAPVMAKVGVSFYGIDTLLAEDGFRVLSEINAANPNGMMQIEELTGEPIVERLALAMRASVKRQKRALHHKE